MINTIRMGCGYTDEYILNKSFVWVRSTFELCIMQNYNNNLQLANLVMHLYAAGMSKEVQPPKTFGQNLLEMRTKKDKKSEKWFADDNVIAGLGMRTKVQKPVKKKKE